MLALSAVLAALITPNGAVAALVPMAVVVATRIGRSPSKLLIPVALSAAAELDVSVRPVLMCVTIACAASFLTPISTPGNMIVMGPGGYRFGDCWRFGLPLLALFFVVAVLLVPQLWGF